MSADMAGKCLATSALLFGVGSTLYGPLVLGAGLSIIGMVLIIIWM